MELAGNPSTAYTNAELSPDPDYDPTYELPEFLKRQGQSKLMQFYQDLHWGWKLGIAIGLLIGAILFTAFSGGGGIGVLAVLAQVAVGVGVGIAMWAASTWLSGNELTLEGLGNAALDSFLASAAIAFVTSGVSFIKHLSRGKPVSTAELAKTANANQVGQQPPQKITGYTKHGLDQAMFRDGHGVSPKGILDAVRNPVDIVYDVQRDTFKFKGLRSTTILNRQGQVVSTWAKSSIFWRY